MSCRTCTDIVRKRGCWLQTKAVWCGFCMRGRSSIEEDFAYAMVRERFYDGRITSGFPIHFTLTDIHEVEKTALLIKRICETIIAEEYVYVKLVTEVNGQCITVCLEEDPEYEHVARVE